MTEENTEPIEEQTEVPVVSKPKRIRSEAQMEALAKARAKAIAMRKEAMEAKKEVKKTPPPAQTPIQEEKQTQKEPEQENKPPVEKQSVSVPQIEPASSSKLNKEEIYGLFTEFHNEYQSKKKAAREEEERNKPVVRQPKFKFNPMLQRFVYTG